MRRRDETPRPIKGKGEGASRRMFLGELPGAPGGGLPERSPLPLHPLLEAATVLDEKPMKQISPVQLERLGWASGLERRVKRRLGITALILATGCATGRSAVADPFPAAARSLRAQSPTRASIVSVDEIRSIETGYTALEAVRRLRPEFLSRHATPRPGDAEEGFAVVYMDGVRLGGLQTLANIPVTTIVEIRYLRTSAAAEQFGRTHRGGVILVSTIR
jgi:hypothetical protein